MKIMFAKLILDFIQFVILLAIFYYIKDFYSFK